MNQLTDLFIEIGVVTIQISRLREIDCSGSAKISHGNLRGNQDRIGTGLQRDGLGIDIGDDGTPFSPSQGESNLVPVTRGLVTSLKLKRLVLNSLVSFNSCVALTAAMVIWPSAVAVSVSARIRGATKDPRRFVGPRKFGLTVDGLAVEFLHQGADVLPADFRAVQLEHAAQHPRSGKGMLQMQLINQPHQPQITLRRWRCAW